MEQWTCPTCNQQMDAAWREVHQAGHVVEPREVTTHELVEPWLFWVFCFLVGAAGAMLVHLHR